MSGIPGLVLSGGGARASYQAGALKALGEILSQRQIPFPVLSGTSAGGINTSYLAARADNWVAATEGLHQTWAKLKLNDVYHTNSASLSSNAVAWISRTLLGGKIGTRRRANYLLNTAPLHDLLKRDIDFDQVRAHIRAGTLRAVSLAAVQYFAQGTLFFFEGHPSLQEWERSGRRSVRSRLGVEHVLASAAIPVFFPPVPIGDFYFGDGSLRQTSPLSPAIHLGADRLLTIGIRPFSKTTQNLPARVRAQAPSLAQITGEVLNSIFLDSTDADTERLLRINESLRKMPDDLRRADEGALRIIPILQLAPSRNLGDLVPDLVKVFPPTLRFLFAGLGASDRDEQGKELLSYLAFTGECTIPLMNLGYEDTYARRDEILRFME